MKITAFAIAMLFIGLQTWGQRQLSFEANGLYNSNAVPKKIPQAFFYGGFLDSQTLATTYAALPKRSAFGLQMHANVQYRTNRCVSKDPQKKAASWSWLFGAGVSQYTGIQFDKDAFGFVFLGGAPFVGDTLYFSNSRLQSMSFSKLGIGVFNAQTQSSLQLNLIGIQNLIDARFSNATWYQDPVQDSIHIELAAKGSYSTRPLSALGLGLDLDYRFVSETETDPIIFQLKVENLGFAYQIKPLEQVQLNGSYHYGAMDLQSLQQLQIANALDTALSDLGFQRSELKKWTLLPTSIQLAKMVNQDSSIRVQAYYGAHFLLRQTYTPLIFAGAHFYVNKKWQTGVGAAYGGFGGLRAQAYSAFTFEKFQIFLRSDNVSLKNGASIYMQVKCAL
ncbi:MAG: hypothetical protein ACKOWW_02820 [Flavobacteriales bacterium]